MNFVQPIRDKQKIEQIKMQLMKKKYMYYMLFTLGVNTGFRISDLLRLKVYDVREKQHISTHETKTRKYKKAYINASLREEINKFIDGMDDEDFLFQSREGKNKAISRERAYQILNEVADKIGLDEIGTHTMRKTFGYWHYQQHHDVALLQDLYGHSSPSITLTYIGVTQDNMDESVKDFYL